MPDQHMIILYHNERGEEIGRGNVQFGVGFAMPMGAVRGLLYLHAIPVPGEPE